MSINPPHKCPGGCGVSVPHNRLACQPCWWLLPEPLRQRVNRRDPDHLTAVSEALVWYRANVRGGEPL